MHHKGHVSTFGCRVCEVKGEHPVGSRRGMYFLQTTAQERTMDSFENGNAVSTFCTWTKNISHLPLFKNRLWVSLVKVRLKPCHHFAVHSFILWKKCICWDTASVNSFTVCWLKPIKVTNTCTSTTTNLPNTTPLPSTRNSCWQLVKVLMRQELISQFPSKAVGIILSTNWMASEPSITSISSYMSCLLFLSPSFQKTKPEQQWWIWFKVALLLCNGN